MADASAFDITLADTLEGVPHGFFGHSGAAHQFGYGGEGEEAALHAARAAAAEAILPGGALVMPHQVHSPDVLHVTAAWDDTATGRPTADALVSATPGLVLGVVTADCAPVLFADAEAGVIGAAHAGWRGAHGGVLENTVAAMEALGARRARIVAAIGPTIAQASYEVDEGFRSQFAPKDARHFAPGRAGHWQFDLPAYVAARLQHAGIGQVEDLALDTYALESRFYSYRRATHQGAPNYGRQLSLIALR
ncbi:peptidoglycan editing factor PgeF [Altererythrobacter sp. BO-6]|uniref:peptidoglycan editing factor PgeF n=1 Tax=Altererythrobacter sp. BO-6 TaxID=2604537 RepID=UPI0013E206A6|nr:peptidoglycan editing factor PgeF [Altererythrobacter sp. BO-6]QIG54356.1 peptidoglycan editing factor PgeF [Altererythrobacter sp. BO-6]